MAGILFIIAAVLLIACISLHRSADKIDEKFANRPTIITNPSKDLFINQKYAVVKLLAFIQGASSASAFDDEANKIVQSTIFSLGLSQSEVEKILKHSMNRNPDDEMRRIFQSLDEIRDRDYLRNLYQKCLKVANISGDYDTIEATKDIFRKLRVL
ncbi:MAG: hypothetical protein MR541_03635 [Prevotella sp.]|nr:hypothetical protein [Prevotella sp.]